jgi:hypothetical protein
MSYEAHRHVSVPSSEIDVRSGVPTIGVTLAVPVFVESILRGTRLVMKYIICS